MAHKTKLWTRMISFFTVVNIATIAAQAACPKGQFKSTFTASCSECPEDPKTNCKDEGDDAESCEKSCILDDQSEESSVNIGIPVGIIAGVLLLLLVIVTVWYCNKKKSKNGCHVNTRHLMCVPTENVDVEATAGVNNEDQPMITSSQPPSPSHPPPPPPPMPPQVLEPLGDNRQYNGPEISSDLNKNIEEDASSSLPQL